MITHLSLFLSQRTQRSCGTLKFKTVQTDLAVEAKKPPIVVMDKKEGKCLIIRLPVNTHDLRYSTNSSKAETLSYERRLMNTSSEVSIYALLYLTKKYLHLVLKSRGPRTSRSEGNINCIYFNCELKGLCHGSPVHFV